MSPMTPEEFLQENFKVWEYRNLCEAAPDMLAALKWLVEAHQLGMFHLDAVEAAKAAIAKAEGKS